VLQTDASGLGVAAVLYQERNGLRNIISYSSARLNDAQRRYHINEQECLAVVFAIKKYRPYLEDKPFLLRTDNKCLLWLNGAKDSNAKLTRWSLLLQEFNFRIEHCPGKNNELPDVLSRQPEDVEIPDDTEDVDRMLVPKRKDEATAATERHRRPDPDGRSEGHSTRRYGIPKGSGALATHPRGGPISAR
jgi:hypothetical protein